MIIEHSGGDGEDEDRAMCMKYDVANPKEVCNGSLQYPSRTALRQTIPVTASKSLISILILQGITLFKKLIKES